MKIEELTAAEAAMIATTKRSGSEIGRAFRSIILNLQQVSGEFDGEIIDEGQLKKVESRCHSLGVELETLKDGVATLRDPMEVLKELAQIYNSLPDDSAEKQGLISDLGGKYHANALSGLLSRWDLYEKMLSEFSQGTNSALEEARKTADSWEGRLNSLQNSFDSFVNSITNKDVIKGGISFFDRLIQGAEALTDRIGELPVLLTAIHASMVVTNRDYGITQIWNKDKRKIDLQGNIFGLDFTAMKNMKNHFAEAESAIGRWNTELEIGNVDINDFNYSVAQNNAQFKEYLSTCSKDAPASLEGYKSHLRAAGVSTDELRLKTVLLNSAITMIGGFAIQAAITGFYKLSKVNDDVAEEAKTLGKTFGDTKSEIEGYKSKIEELHKTIDDSNSSIEDVTNARKTLLAIQDELINKFGTEKSVIDDVTEAIKGQTNALDDLTEAKWQEAKNDFVNRGFLNDVANFFRGTDNIQRMLNEYGEKTILFRWSDYADINELTDGMVAELENIGIDIKVNTDNLQAIRDFDSLNESIDNTNGASLALSGNAEEIYNTLLALQNLIGSDASLGKLYDRVGNVADSYKELTEKYKNFYNQYILYEKILSEGSDYTGIFKDIIDAYEQYNEVLVSGDEGKIREKADGYAKIVSTAIASAMANGDTDVATYFGNMYPALKDIVNSWEFNVAFDANTDDLQDELQSVLNELRDDSGRSLTIVEILGLDKSNAQYQRLISTAHAYNMTIEDMIALLKERNLVSEMDYQGLVGLFGQKNVDNLPVEDLEIAYKIENIGNITFEQLLNKIQKIKDSANASTIFTAFENTDFGTRIQHITDLFNEGTLSHKEYFSALQTEITNFDASSFTNSMEDMTKASSQFFVDSVQQTASGLSSLIDSFHNSEISISEYLDGYLAIGDTLSTLTDSLQENSAAWNEHGQAISEVGNVALDDTQNKLSSAMSVIESYQDSIYALEEIMNHAVTVGSDEFTAHANVIAQDLYRIALNGGEMADVIVRTLGSTTSEIAQSLTESVSNQEIACQAIMANTNVAIEDMSSSIGELFDTLGDAISNFKVDLSFGVKSVDWKKVDVLGVELSLPEIKFELGASGESLDQIGNALSAFGKTVASNYTPQTIELEDFHFGSTDAAKERKYSPGASITDNYKNALDDLKSTSQSAAKEAETDWKSLLDKETALLEKQLEAGVITFRQYTDKRRAIIDQYYRDGKVKAADYYAALEDMYKYQLSAYDRVIKAVNKQLDEQVKQLEKQKESVEDSYQIKIDAIQEEIDALKEANEARKSQIELEKAQYEVERAKNQRTKKVYNGNEFVYEADHQSIRDAENNLADQEFQLNLSRLESQIESLKEELEKATDSIDLQIEALQSYKDKWNEISSAYEDQQNKLIAAEIMGADWEKDVLNGRLDVLNAFKIQYIQIQQDMANAAWNAANEQLKAAQEAVNAANNQKTDTPKSPKNDPPKQEPKQELPKKEPPKNSGGGGGVPIKSESSKNFDKIMLYASGTENARRGVNLVGEDGIETYIDNDGNASLVTAPTLIPMDGGETVKNEQETKKLLQGLEEKKTALFNEDSEFVARRPSDILEEQIRQVFPNFRNLVPEVDFMYNIPKFNDSIVPQKNVTTISIGDIHLHEVKDTNSFAKAIIQELPGRMHQLMHKC